MFVITSKCLVAVVSFTGVSRDVRRAEVKGEVRILDCNHVVPSAPHLTVAD